MTRALILIVLAAAVAGAAWYFQGPSSVDLTEFTVGETTVEVTAEIVDDAELPAGLGYLPGHPFSSAFLSLTAKPRVFPGSFDKKLTRTTISGEAVTTRALFRSQKFSPLRQTLLVQKIQSTEAAGAALLEWELRIDGTMTDNQKEFWFTLDPTGKGPGGYSVMAEGAFDVDTRRLDVAITQRLDAEQPPQRFRLGFELDDAQVFQLVEPAPAR